LNELFQRLPAPARTLADVQGGEAAWRRADLKLVSNAARAVSLATTGAW